tara:strand:+ start:324 stop:431 length:108 start_codon:yes stop_codon:yes gene_type:complete
MCWFKTVDLPLLLLLLLLLRLVLSSVPFPVFPPVW